MKVWAKTTFYYSGLKSDCLKSGCLTLVILLVALYIFYGFTFLADWSILSIKMPLLDFIVYAFYKDGLAVLFGTIGFFSSWSTLLNLVLAGPCLFETWTFELLWIWVMVDFWPYFGFFNDISLFLTGSYGRFSSKS